MFVFATTCSSFERQGDSVLLKSGDNSQWALAQRCVVKEAQRSNIMAISRKRGVRHASGRKQYPTYSGRFASAREGTHQLIVDASQTGIRRRDCHWVRGGTSEKLFREKTLTLCRLVSFMSAQESQIVAQSPFDARNRNSGALQLRHLQRQCDNTIVFR